MNKFEPNGITYLRGTDAAKFVVSRNHQYIQCAHDSQFSIIAGITTDNKLVSLFNVHSIINNNGDLEIISIIPEAIMQSFFIDIQSIAASIIKDGQVNGDPYKSIIVNNKIWDTYQSTIPEGERENRYMNVEVIPSEDHDGVGVYKP